MKLFGTALLVASSLFAVSPSQAQEAPVRTVNVGVYATDPFVTKSPTGELSGFDIELWKVVADDLRLKTNFVYANSFPDLLDSVKNKQVDAALSSITINNERHKVMDFSTPYFNSGLMIMVRENESKGFVGSLKSFFMNDIPTAFDAIYIPFIVIAITMVVWFLFHAQGHKAFKNSTAKDVYRNVLGVCCVVFMFFLLFMSVARLTSTMTAEHFTYQLSIPRDLRGKSVATVAGTTSVPVLNSYGANVSAVTDINDAYDMLIAGQVDAIVYDAPTLQYYAKTTGAGKVAAVGSIFAEQPYGIALPQDSDLRRAIDASILKMKENGVYDALYQRYFGVE